MFENNLAFQSLSEIFCLNLNKTCGSINRNPCGALSLPSEALQLATTLGPIVVVDNIISADIRNVSY